MKHFSFTIIENSSIGYNINVGVDITAATLALETRKSSVDAWASSTAMTLSKPGTTMLALTLPGANATSAFAPTYYRVLSDSVPVLTGYIYYSTAQEGTGGGIRPIIEGIVHHDGTAGGGTRPDGFSRIKWVGGTARPTNMVAGDVWEHDA